MTAYYNEFDKYAAEWLRNLIAEGLIAPGIVDDRSIEDVTAGDLAGFTQCHFFAGIGVWSYALRRAGWPDSRRVWTASCPCQPFSAAGKGAGFADERHLWPAFYHLVTQCGPDDVFGEQVASGDGLAWLDLVQTDMEAARYAFGAVDLCAAGVGAPHIRQRLYWVANSEYARPHGGAVPGGVSASQNDRRVLEPKGRRAALRLEHAGSIGRNGRETTAPGHNDDRATSERAQSEHGLGIASAHRLHQHGAGPVNGRWSDADWLLCRDGKWRPVEPGTFPLANGAPARVGRLRAYGNAIVAPLAETFVRAYLACKP